MRIQNMFQDDIDRKINGVVKVDQNAADVLAQEVKEHITGFHSAEAKKVWKEYTSDYYVISCN